MTSCYIYWYSMLWCFVFRYFHNPTPNTYKKKIAIWVLVMENHWLDLLRFVQNGKHCYCVPMVEHILRLVYCLMQKMMKLAITFKLLSYFFFKVLFIYWLPWLSLDLNYIYVNILKSASQPPWVCSRVLKFLILHNRIRSSHKAGKIRKNECVLYDAVEILFHLLPVNPKNEKRLLKFHPQYPRFGMVWASKGGTHLLSHLETDWGEIAIRLLLYPLLSESHLVIKSWSIQVVCFLVISLYCSSFNIILTFKLKQNETRKREYLSHEKQFRSFGGSEIHQTKTRWSLLLGDMMHGIELGDEI